MTRKILLSLLVIVAVVTAIGLITFAIFSDNIASDEQLFTAGTVDITVDEQEEFFQTELDMLNMEPGDCARQTVRVSNEGTLPVNLWNWIYTWGDIFHCDPNASCNMYVQKTMAAESTADGPEFIAPGGWEDYDLEACLPLCAGNNCQGDAGGFRLFFHAVQQSNLDGYECVKMEDKSAPDWLPNATTPQHGNLCYAVVPDTGTDGCEDLSIIVNAYGLTADADFQLDLTGGDMDDPHDGACMAQDAVLASMSTDLYTAGYWNWGTYLEASCDATNGGEGVWNYAGVYGGVHSDGTGSISYMATLDGFTAGNYILKSHVKEITAPFPGTAWTERLAEMDYLQFTITCVP